MAPGDAHVDAKKQGKAFLYVPGQVRRRYQKSVPRSFGGLIFMDWIRTPEGVDEATLRLCCFDRSLSEKRGPLLPQQQLRAGIIGKGSKTCVGDPSSL